MKRLLIALLSMSLVTVGGITASAQTNEAEPVIANAAVSCSALANCPNNGIPALDGTEYQGGRNEDFVSSVVTDSTTDSTTGTAVSYTHLDVYKRQPIKISCSLTSPVSLFKSRARTRSGAA